MARRLKAAGLDRVTVSMDAVDPETFARITRVPRSFQRVLDGIHAAQDAGLGPVKVNCVLLRGWNDDQIELFGEFARREQASILRFIEFMPLEEDRIWAPDVVVREAEIVERLQRVAPVVPLPPNHLSETARRYAFADGTGEIGIIAPVSRPFCGHCSRIRLTSDGKLRTCLFSQTDHDLYGRMLSGACHVALSTPTSGRWSTAKNAATTLASQVFSSLHGAWCTSAAKALLYPTMSPLGPMHFCGTCMNFRSNVLALHTQTRTIAGTSADTSRSSGAAPSRAGPVGGDRCWDEGQSGSASGSLRSPTRCSRTTRAFSSTSRAPSPPPCSLRSSSPTSWKKWPSSSATNAGP